MQALTICNVDDKTLSQVMRCCESLDDGSPYWDGPTANFLNSILINAPLSQKDFYASKIIETAVPEEGDIHPQRAEWHGEEFYTPGGVSIMIQKGDVKHKFNIHIDFSRDSRYLAFVMLSRVVEHSSFSTVVVVDGKENTVANMISHLLTSRR